jgi:D-alanyl-D-alanine carboxypeptidase
MRRIKTKKTYFIILVIIILVAIFVFAWPGPAQPSSPNNPSTDKTVPVAGFNKSQLSLTDPTSLWVVVNKQRPLNPLNYAPADLVTPNVPLRVPGNESMQVRSVMVPSLEALFQAARTQGVPLMLSSGYRSYSYQVGLYNSYVKSSGQAAADNYSARPGHSEHQTGLAVDVEPLNQKCDVDPCFANLPEGKWLAANAYKYGFILRYPADKVAVTGYSYEPWHIRYVGAALSSQLNNQHIETLEEFFGLPAAPNYS